MGENKQFVSINDEDVLNLLDCLERTKIIQTPGVDLWPFTIKRIINSWENKNKIIWTKDKPTAVGFYWVKSLLEVPQPCMVSEGRNKQFYVLFFNDKEFYSANGLHDGYEFYGPIEVPK